MFNSQCLVSKTGPLGTIWLAAHCFKRLKKDQLKQTDIPSSVDRILRNEVEELTYRILANLLLGVVRVFSKKVDYLFHDCHDVMRNLKDFASGKSAVETIEAMRTSSFSITLPERFELDAFDLGVLTEQEVGSCNVRAPEEIMLADTDNVGAKHSNDKGYWNGGHFFEAYSSMCTPVKDVFPDHLMDIDSNVTPSHDMHDLESSLGKHHEVRFSLEERLEPVIFHESEKEFNLEMRSDEAKVDALVKSFGEEESMDKLSGTEKGISNSNDGAKESQTNQEQTKNLECGIDIARAEKCDEERNVEPEEREFPEMAPITSQIAAKRPMSITIDSKCTGGSGVVSPEFMAVRTPATKESARTVKKRKCFFDDTAVLSNKIMKASLDDSSDLVCKRRKAPYTCYHAWKANKISNLPRSFLDPLIPWNLGLFRSLVQQNKFTTREHVENAKIHVNEVTSEAPINQVLAESPAKDKSAEAAEQTPIAEILVNGATNEVPINHVLAESPAEDRSAERTPIAPSTPVTHPTSLRLHEIRGAFRPDILEAASSCESIEKCMTREEDHELEASLMDEEIDSSAGDTRRENKCSIRARKVGRYLYEKFQDQRRRKGEMSINLTQVSKGKSRKESARLFYEILVLKTGGYIDVRQEKAFGDILVQETPELKKILDG